MNSTLLSWYYRVVDILFPILCLGCRREGSFLCDTCFARLPEKEIQECPICRMPYSRSGAVCKLCQKKTALDGLLIAAPYKDQLIERLIHTLKYRFIEAIAEPLAQVLTRALEHHPLPLPDVIIPVPLHPKRLRYRGFNQSLLIAEALARHLTPGLPLPIENRLMLRHRFTKPQMSTMSRQERIENLRGAFALSPSPSLNLTGKNIWLIDDVATTGTTLEECSQVLKQAGARSVWALVIAR